MRVGDDSEWRSARREVWRGGRSEEGEREAQSENELEMQILLKAATAEAR